MVFSLAVSFINAWITRYFDVKTFQQFCGFKYCDAINYESKIDLSKKENYIYFVIHEINIYELIYWKPQTDLLIHPEWKRQKSRKQLEG